MKKKSREEQNNNSPKPLVKPDESLLKPEEDYYFTPDGLMVFKASYHLKRGYCCGSGCRHCPYKQ